MICSLHNEKELQLFLPLFFFSLPPLSPLQNKWNNYFISLGPNLEKPICEKMIYWKGITIIINSYQESCKK